MTKVEDRELRQANVRYQRLTAWGCAQSGHPYDVAKCAEAKAEFEAVVQRVFP